MFIQVSFKDWILCQEIGKSLHFRSNDSVKDCFSNFNYSLSVNNFKIIQWTLFGPVAGTMSKLLMISCWTESDWYILKCSDWGRQQIEFLQCFPHLLSQNSINMLHLCFCMLYWIFDHFEEHLNDRRLMQIWSELCSKINPIKLKIFSQSAI
jgi:hypothetical protein